jgi:hypothetical protein
VYSCEFSNGNSKHEKLAKEEVLRQERGAYTGRNQRKEGEGSFTASESVLQELIINY